MQTSNSTGRYGISNGGNPRTRLSPYTSPHPSKASVELSIRTSSRSLNREPQACCPEDCNPPESRLQDAFIRGAANLNLPTTDLWDEFGDLKAINHQASHTTTAEGYWPMMDLSTNSSPPRMVISGSQRVINERSFVVDHLNTVPRSRPSKSPTPRSPRRPTPEEFCAMVYMPLQHEGRLAEYVGTDSKYTMAANHSSLMVRSSSKAVDIATRMGEVARSLAAINDFLKYLLEYKEMKPEQRGCVSLRISFGALTALMGDFSQGEIPESDPNAPAVPRGYLRTFREYNPALTRLVACLSEKLETSINMYRHRRSPSNSLVTKFEDMIRTLDVWNEALGDDTFRGPTNVITHWLNSHPQQVSHKRQVAARSQQATPNISEAAPPLSHLDSSAFLPPHTAYNLSTPTRSPHNARSPSGRGGPYSAPGTELPSLFEPPAPGITFFPSSLPVPTPYPNDELSTMYAHGPMFHNPGHSSSQGPYPGNQGYSYH